MKENGWRVLDSDANLGRPVRKASIKVSSSGRVSTNQALRKLAKHSNYVWAVKESRFALVPSDLHGRRLTGLGLIPKEIRNKLNVCGKRFFPSGEGVNCEGAFIFYEGGGIPE